MAIIPSNTRFVGISANVDLTERKSARLNTEQEPYTLQDFQDTLTPDLTPITVDGNKVAIAADPLATTQSVAVIQSSTTNAGLVLQPNGTGAIMADIPDGTNGGNARGQYAVDLQMTRNPAKPQQVASGNYSSIIGGSNNVASGDYSISAGGSCNALGANSVAFGSTNTASGSQSVVCGGYVNTASGTQSGLVSGRENEASGQYSFIGGGYLNVNSSLAGVISGGQSNTASTNSHATVVGDIKIPQAVSILLVGGIIM